MRILPESRTHLALQSTHVLSIPRDLLSLGKSFFSPANGQMPLENYMRQIRDRDLEDSYDLLTPREREILQMAASLEISLYTVETHRGNLMEKLNSTACQN